MARVRSGNLLLAREAQDAANAVIVDEFERFAKASAGVKRSELISHTRLSEEVVDFVLKRLETDKQLRIQGERVIPFDDTSRGSDSARLSILCAIYQSAGLAAPSPEAVAANLAIEPAEMRRLFTLLLREKTLVRVGSDSLCVHQHTSRKAI